MNAERVQRLFPQKHLPCNNIKSCSTVMNFSERVIVYVKYLICFFKNFQKYATIAVCCSSIIEYIKSYNMLLMSQLFPIS